MMSKVLQAQQYLKEYNIDGWLLYDFRRSNPLALEFLEIGSKTHLSRRLFYWIPKEGDPVALVHEIEPEVLHHGGGQRLLYQTWQQLGASLQKMLQGARTVAMEYSPNNALPYISKVDAGTVEMIRSFGVEVVSSGQFLQLFTAVLSEEQRRLHEEAAKLLDLVAEETFMFLSQCLERGQTITEYALQQWVLEAFDRVGLITEYSPCCAFGVHTADPHYGPMRESSLTLKADECVLLDFVAKKKGGAYGDITRVGFSGSKVPQKYKMLFDLVKTAQEEAFLFLQKRFAAKHSVKGYEVDQVCRSVIEKGGYGKYFTHRTGHNIDAHTVHGSGAHLDGFETYDDRPLLEKMCFTIEPGIYLPKQWGVRVEYDVLVLPGYNLEITSGVQQMIRTLS